MKKLVLSALFLFCVQASFGQINSQFIKNNDKKPQTDQQELKFDFSKYKLTQWQFNIQPRLATNQNFNLLQNFENDDFWSGSMQTSQLEYYNLKIRSQHSYDINGNLRSSSWSIKFKD